MRDLDPRHQRDSYEKGFFKRIKRLLVHFMRAIYDQTLSWHWQYKKACQQVYYDDAIYVHRYLNRILGYGFKLIVVFIHISSTTLVVRKSTKYLSPHMTVTKLITS